MARATQTLPNPFIANDIRGARPAASALPSPPPAGPQRVQRRLRVGRTHAETIVTIVVEDHDFRVLDGMRELSLHARTSTKTIRNVNAHRPVNGNHVPTTNAAPKS